MKLLNLLKINYGHLLFALAVFVSALDNGLGLNFLTLFIVVTWVMAFFSKSTMQVRLPLPQKVACLMFAAVYLSFIVSEFITFGDLDEAYSVAARYVAVGLLGVIVLSCMRHEITFDSFSPWIGVVAILYAILALIQAYVEQTNRIGLGINPIPTAMISVQLMFWCGCTALVRNKVPAVVLLGAVCAFWVVYLTGSRMPLAVSIYLLVIWVLFTKQAARTRILAVLGCVLIVPVLGILVPGGSTGIFDRFAEVDLGVMTAIASEDPSVNVASSASGMHRAWIWKAGFDLILQQPWFGWGRGMGVTDQALMAVQAPDVVRAHPHFHNELIDTSVRFGVPAAVLLVLSYAGLFGTARTRHQLLVVFVFLSQFFALSLTDAFLSRRTTQWMFVFTVTLLLLYTSPNVKKKTE